VSLPPAAPRTFYAASRLRPHHAGPIFLGHTHCGRCGAPERPRRVVDVIGPRPAHACAYSDMRECPLGCGAPIMRRLPDGAPFNLNLTPHWCPGPDPEDGPALGYWPWYPAQRRRREEAEASERDREAEEYAAWVRYRTAMGIPDAGEGELPPGGGGRP
jgi:hypothetical protein